MKTKILVPLDGSSCALRALQHAIDMTKRASDGILYVVHAHEEPLIYGEIAVYVPRETMAELQRKQSESVLHAAEPLLKAAGIAYETEIRVGPTAQVIAERASALGCNAIVMGTHGLTALGKILMGSIATKVIHLTDIPVTLVK